MMPLQRIWLVAVRDFNATVSSKGFLVGLLIMPLLVLLFVVLGPRILSSRNPPVSGQIEALDPTAAVVPQLRAALDPRAVAARRARDRTATGTPARDPYGPADNAAIPDFEVIERPADAGVAQAKSWLLQRVRPGAPHLAVIVVHPDAVVRGPGRADFGSYDLYLAPHVDEVTETAIRDGMHEALIGARLEHGGIDRGAVEAAMRVVQPEVSVVTLTGQQPTRRGIARMLPFACGILLFIGIITGGQILMTSTVEEKASRVIEVLLAAVSPAELMAGKLIAQLGVGLIVLAVYLGLAMLALIEYALAGVLPPLLIVYLIVFYLLAYLVYGGLMLAVGAAVNQVAEAQSLMGPVMLLLIAPYVLVPLIGLAPNSALSVAMSFVPPINSFAILARLASGTPPPLWQVLGSMLAGIAGALAAVWFAAKVFRIGLLMHGKPPNFATLVRWVRAA